MNCPTKDTDETWARPGYNQNPRRFDSNLISNVFFSSGNVPKPATGCDDEDGGKGIPLDAIEERSVNENGSGGSEGPKDQAINHACPSAPPPPPLAPTVLQTIQMAFLKYVRFLGPGLMVSVAYMDPGNYSTAVAGGANHQFALLFVILLSSIIALVLQSLAIKLGSVTGMDLARCCREYLPKWMSITLYIFAEIAIVATDIAEVIGTAIALDILLHIPLIAGVCMTIVDVLIVLFAYRPGGGMRVVRFFEYAVAALVLGVSICFIILLCRIPHQSVRKIFRGFAPSRALIQGTGIVDSAGILGATVMPHSLFLGSGLVQPRLREWDVANGTAPAPDSSKDSEEEYFAYKPTIGAIKYCLKYSIIELVTTLFTLALFVNSAILIVSGATLYGNSDASTADLYGIHSLLRQYISKGAGTIFMLALLLSGQSAGIVCTIAGQMVSEGFLRWTIRPWLRRIITRSIAVVPCVVVAAAVGKEGLNSALNYSQVALTLLLPFLTFPLIYFTNSKKLMKVARDPSVTADDASETTVLAQWLDYSNHWVLAIVCWALWLFIAILNVYLIVQLGMGNY